jgi:hypothetical protein
MPLSVYQTTSKSELIQAAFDPKSSHLILLSINGDLVCRTINGEDQWSVSLGCESHGFGISADGDQIAVLADEELIFYQVWSGETSKVPVDKKSRLLATYKNCALVSGYHEIITMFTPGGKVFNSLASEGLIRQMKVVPLLDQIMIYTEDKTIQSFDMTGEIQWELEKTILTGNFVISAAGEIGYFIRYPNDLIKFSLTQDDFFRLETEYPSKLLDLTADGSFLLVLDSENIVTLCGRDAQPVVQQKMDHSIRMLNVSPTGNHFLTLDEAGVLNCFVADESIHESGDFFEFNDARRVEEKEVLWNLQPGIHQKIQGFNLPTLNPARSHVGIIGLDAQIYFIDESGQFSSKIRAPFRAEAMGMDTAMEYGYIYGEQQILLLDFNAQTTGFILLKTNLLSLPVINFNAQQVFILTEEKTLVRYSFCGEQLDSIPAKNTYRRGFSCDAFGMVLYNDRELAGFSNEGQVVFKMSLPAPLVTIDYVDDHLIGATKDNQLFCVNLFSGKPQKGKFLKRAHPFSVVSTRPLLIIEDDRLLHYLDVDFASISKHSIQSKDSCFLIEDSHFFEIGKHEDGLFCMDDRQQMIWRVRSEDPVLDFMLTRNGLIMLTEENLQYVAMKSTSGRTTELSDYLEV